MYSSCTGKRSHTSNNYRFYCHIMYSVLLEWLRLLATIALVTIAMLCKEQGITIIAVCCVYEVFVAQKVSYVPLPVLCNEICVLSLPDDCS